MLYAAEHNEVHTCRYRFSTGTGSPAFAHCAMFAPSGGILGVVQVWVHSGFLTAYRSVAPRLLALAQEVTEGMGSTLIRISLMLR